MTVVAIAAFLPLFFSFQVFGQTGEQPRNVTPGYSAIMSPLQVLVDETRVEPAKTDDFDWPGRIAVTNSRFNLELYVGRASVIEKGGSLKPLGRDVPSEYRRVRLPLGLRIEKLDGKKFRGSLARGWTLESMTRILGYKPSSADVVPYTTLPPEKRAELETKPTPLPLGKKGEIAFSMSSPPVFEDPPDPENPSLDRLAELVMAVTLSISRGGSKIELTTLEIRWQPSTARAAQLIASR